MATNQAEYEVAHDGGNGYMKDSVNEQRSIFPSVISRVLPSGEPEPININDFDEVKNVLNNYLNYMDVTVQSQSIHNNGRFLVGNIVTDNGMDGITFNVNSTEGKSHSDISLICLFALLAYKGLKDVFEGTDLPQVINITVNRMITALPIDEIKIKGAADAYKQRFTDNDHVVLINTFTQPITVNLHFEQVSVMPEGVVAEYGVIGDPRNSDDYRDDDLFNELREQYNLPGFDGEDVLQIGNVLGIDIGEGTVDFSIIKGVSPVPRLNSSIYMGVGNVIENATQALHEQYPSVPIMDRQTFMKIANSHRGRESQAYLQCLNEQKVALEDQITERVKTIYTKMKGQIDLIIVSGGGAAAMKDHYYKEFKRVIDEVSPFGAAPLLWVPNKYTQTLNLDGMEFRLKRMS